MKGHVGQIVGVQADGVLQLTAGLLGSNVVTQDFSTTVSVTSSGPGQCNLVTIDPELHTPPVVQFSWGSESFQGVVTQLEEKMTLFDSEGHVIRARVTATLKSYESVDAQMRLNPTFSPDRTRIRVTKAGETLPQIAYEAYGDPSLWRSIAEENNLQRPRFIDAGTTLIVPAIGGD